MCIRDRRCIASAITESGSRARGFTAFTITFSRFASPWSGSSHVSASSGHSGERSHTAHLGSGDSRAVRVCTARVGDTDRGTE
eukprot:3419087-Prymnesium_polylepis.1